MTNDRVITVTGILFAIGTFAGLLLLLGGAAVGDTTNAEAADWLGKGAHRTRMMVGAYVMAGGAVAFMVYAAGLLQRMRNTQAPQLAVNVAQLAGTVFALLVLAAAVGMASGAYAVQSGVEPQPIDVGAVRVSTFGFMLWAIAGALAGATFITAVSIGSFVSGVLPRWLALLGLLFAVLALFGIEFLPTLGILVWAILVGIVALVRTEPRPLAEPQTA